MKSTRFLLLAPCAFAVLLPLFAQSGSQHATHNLNPAHASQQHKEAPTSDGQRVFRQNCARCHDAPQSFPPQITGTVLRHMRVRASLSANDEKALLEFMNP